MHELLEICEVASRSAEPLFLATVVRVRGSAYRQPGARMLFATGRVLAGSVSGGCLEADIVRRGPWAATQGPLLRTYEGVADDDGETQGSGCDGSVDILIEACGSSNACDVLPHVGACLKEERALAIATIYRSERAAARVGARLVLSAAGAKIASSVGHAETEAELTAALESVLATRKHIAFASRDGAIEALLENVQPAPRLFVFGAGPDALPVLELTHALGWSSTLCSPHAGVSVRNRFFSAHTRVIENDLSRALAELERCARPLAVVMSHNYEYDRAALAGLLASRALYIGVLGPARRSERMLSELGHARASRSDAVLARVHGPAGLHLGAETPAEIALSLLAEAQAALTRTSATPLRDRMAPIHERVSEPDVPLWEAPTLRVAASRRG